MHFLEILVYSIIGSIILFSEGTKKNATETELKMLQVATDFLSNQM